VSISVHCFVKQIIICGLAVVFHPRHKLKYFKWAGWEPEWIAAATDIICAKFDRSYAVQPGNVEEDQDGDIEMSEK
jgi:hypothetical protein